MAKFDLIWSPAFLRHHEMWELADLKPKNTRHSRRKIWGFDVAHGRVGRLVAIRRLRDRQPPLYLPQLAELKIPRPMDVAGGGLLYDGFMKRVYLADAQTEERSALRLMLLDLNLQIVGEAADWPTALAQAPATRPDMVVVDWDLVAKGSGAAHPSSSDGTSGQALAELGLLLLGYPFFTNSLHRLYEESRRWNLMARQQPSTLYPKQSGKS